MLVLLGCVDVNAEAGTKLAEETTEKPSVTGIIAGEEEAVTGDGEAGDVTETETTGLEAMTEKQKH